MDLELNMTAHPACCVLFVAIMQPVALSAAGFAIHLMWRLHRRRGAPVDYAALDLQMKQQELLQRQQQLVSEPKQEA